MKVIERLAPTDGYGRTGGPLWGFRGITVHNTSNWSKGADAMAHANLLRNGWKYKYISWHYVIDENYAIRCVPENETAWCAGDGNGDGNRKTINIEICDNADGDIFRATENAAQLCADILKRRGITNASKYLFQHNNWTGKDCPWDIRRNNPYDWNTFVNSVQRKLNGESVITIDQVLEAGSKCVLNGIFNVDEILTPNDKYKNGALGCHALCYGSPVGNNDWIPLDFIAKLDRNKDRADYDAVIKVNDKFMCDKIFTVKAVEAPTKFTPNGVAIIENDGVEFRIDCGPLYEI